ncbi:MAG TPA: trehalose-6-phosphate synthase [Rhizomicrobium sp.]|nr:trehalose-6-phosphate synthase [Rhizomicrobium sp.]
MARIFIVSNRVAVPDPARGPHAGGLEVALRSTLKRHSCVWLGWSGEVSPDNNIHTRTVKSKGNTYIVSDLTEADYQEYYNGFANKVLWPILHYRLDLAEFSRRDLTGYMRVNNTFADQLEKVLKPDDIIWVHDYHLIPLAKALRDRGFMNRIGFFLHIPLPPPEILTAMPNHERLIPLLMEYDLVGFQTDNDASNFARYLANEVRMLAHIPRGPATGDRSMRVGAFPVGIETQEFHRRARRAARSSFVTGVLDSLPGKLIIGVDRLDYSKGLSLRLDAFESFLIANPDWRRRVTYLQITPKSRSEIHEYAEMERSIDTAAGRINSTYGEVAWSPVRYVNRAYSRTALGGLYHEARVALVTPLRDGMNLVAKEYVAAQDADDPGVLILSRFAGAAAELSAAVLVNPYDHEAVGAAIARALAMPLAERKSRHNQLWDALLKNDVSGWSDRFLSALTGEQIEKPARTARQIQPGAKPTASQKDRSSGDAPAKTAGSARR